MRIVIVALALAAAACGDDAPPDCDRPIDPPPWLEEHVDDTIGRLSGQRPLTSGVTLTDRNSVAARDATRDWLADQLASYGYTPERQDYATGSNLYARLASTTGDDGWIVIGAHFDTVPSSPGADDNGSGVAVVLGVARQLRDLPCRGPGVIVAFFDQEEIGIVGSTQFAGMLFQTQTRVVAVHTVDQVGWDADGDRRYELESPTPELEADYAATAARLGLAVTTTGTVSSDHQAFRERGFPATGVSEEFAGGDTTPFFHSPGDTYDTVLPYQPYVVLAARLVGETVMDELAP